MIRAVMIPFSAHLPISHTITVDNDAVRKIPIDGGILFEGICGAGTKVVSKLLSSMLKHALGEISARERGRDG